MLLTRSETDDSFAMSDSGVTFVPGKAIIRIDPVQNDHDLIAANLGNDGGGADCIDRRVAANDSLSLDPVSAKSQLGETISVDQHIMRLHTQSEDGAAHSQKRCLEDVQAVDLGRIRPGDRPGQRTPPYLASQLGSSAGAQFLGIPETVDWRTTVQDDCAGYNRARERTPPSFINTGNRSPGIMK